MKSFMLVFLGLSFLLQNSFANKPTAQDWIAKGDALDRQSKTKEALAAYREADQLKPNDGDIMLNIAKQLCDSIGDNDPISTQKKLASEALSYAQRAVKANPKDSDAHLTLAVCYAKLSSSSDNRTKIELSRKIKESALKAIELNPRNDTACFLLGRWNYELSGVNPVLSGLANVIYGSLPKASLTDSIAYFKKAVAIAPNRVQYHIELGRAYAAAGQKELARQEIQRGLALPNTDKDDPDTKKRGKQILSTL